MSAIDQLIETVRDDLEQRLPHQRKTQRDKLAILVGAMLHIRSANLMDLAAGLPRDLSIYQFHAELRTAGRWLHPC